MGAHIARLSQACTCSAPPPVIGNTPVGSRHPPNSPDAGTQEKLGGGAEPPTRPSDSDRSGPQYPTGDKQGKGEWGQYPLTDDSCHFFLSYHLKGVCNRHCGGRHLHIPLSQSEFGRLGEWRECFYSRDEAPPLREVDTGV